MRDLSAVAELLRDVWAARRRFLRLAAVERAMIDPMLDRVARDLESAAAPAPPQGTAMNANRPADDNEGG